MGERKEKGTILHIYTEALHISTIWCSRGEFSIYANFLSCPEVRYRLFGPAESGGILINVLRDIAVASRIRRGHVQTLTINHAATTLKPTGGKKQVGQFNL